MHFSACHPGNDHERIPPQGMAPHRFVSHWVIGFASRVALFVHLLMFASEAFAQAPQVSLEKGASLLQASTVTVRVTVSAKGSPSSAGSQGAAPSPADSAAKPASDGKKTSGVSVFSGVCIGKGLLATPLFNPVDSGIRITLPGGEQTSARVRVLDEVSGLALLETDRDDLVPLECSEPPAAGSWVLSAAGWGVEKPVVSLGIVSGLDRTIPESGFPPLIQCDLRTAETSTGSGVADSQGRLVGIVVASDSAGRGWTFAVPSNHLQRLLRAKSEADAKTKADAKSEADAKTKSDAKSELASAPQTQNNAQTQGNSIIVLKRRRPIVGMVLDTAEEKVIVSRVDAGSPADRAGIRAGDEIVAADGVRIRSVYQALRPVLQKQPGDLASFVVVQGGEEKRIELVLGGGVELPGPTPEGAWKQLARGVLNIEGDGRRYQARDGQGNIRELAAPPLPSESTDPSLPRNADRPGGAASPREPGAGLDPASPEGKIRLLERALESYRQVIIYQQGKLELRDEELKRNRELLEMLLREVETLKSQLGEPKP